jgi:hypothetical protein
LAAPKLRHHPSNDREPLYGGAYAYGKTAVAAGYDGTAVSVKIHRKARSDWLAPMPTALEGYDSWEKAETIRKMVSSNVPTSRHHGAHCGRPLRYFGTGRGQQFARAC